MNDQERTRLIRLPEVMAMIGMGRSTVYLRMQTDPGFPRPIKLSKGRTGAIAWVEAEVVEWIKAQISSCRGGE